MSLYNKIYPNVFLTYVLCQEMYFSYRFGTFSHHILLTISSNDDTLFIECFSYCRQGFRHHECTQWLNFNVVSSTVLLRWCSNCVDINIRKFRNNKNVVKIIVRLRDLLCTWATFKWCTSIHTKYQLQRAQDFRTCAKCMHCLGDSQCCWW